MNGKSWTLTQKKQRRWFKNSSHGKEILMEKLLIKERFLSEAWLYYIWKKLLYLLESAKIIVLFVMKQWKIKRKRKGAYCVVVYFYLRPDFFISWFTGIFFSDLGSGGGGGGGGAKIINKKALKMTSFFFFQSFFFFNISRKTVKLVR